MKAALLGFLLAVVLVQVESSSRSYQRLSSVGIQSDSIILLPTDEATTDSDFSTRWAILIAGSAGYWNYRHQVFFFIFHWQICCFFVVSFYIYGTIRKILLFLDLFFMVITINRRRPMFAMPIMC